MFLGFLLLPEYFFTIIFLSVLFVAAYTIVFSYFEYQREVKADK